MSNHRAGDILKERLRSASEHKTRGRGDNGLQRGTTWIGVCVGRRCALIVVAGWRRLVGRFSLCSTVSEDLADTVVRRQEKCDAGDTCQQARQLMVRVEITHEAL